MAIANSYRHLLDLTKSGTAVPAATKAVDTASRSLAQIDASLAAYVKGIPSSEVRAAVTTIFGDTSRQHEVIGALSAESLQSAALRAVHDNSGLLWAKGSTERELRDAKSELGAAQEFAGMLKISPWYAKLVARICDNIAAYQ